MISAFISLLFACASAQETDFVGELPVEVSSTIFRYLDSESLVAAASVNRRWNSVCKSDSVLRRKIRRRLRQERKARVDAYMKPSRTVKVVRSQNVPAVQFGIRNENVSVQKLSVKYEAPKIITTNSQVKTFKVSMKSDGKAALRSLAKKNKVNVCNNNIRRLRL